MRPRLAWLRILLIGKLATYGLISQTNTNRSLFQRYASLYKTTGIESVYGDEPSVELIASTTAVINVYYDTLRYTMIQETPSVTPEILISNIGSIFGVFTGSSFLSLVELVEISFTIIILAIIYKKKNQQSQASNKAQ